MVFEKLGMQDFGFSWPMWSGTDAFGRSSPGWKN